jgi:hypothetical protein
MAKHIDDEKNEPNYKKMSLGKAEKFSKVKEERKELGGSKLHKLAVERLKEKSKEEK